MPRAKLPTDALLKELRAYGLGLPGAHTKSPWPGHLDLAVNDKTFAYLSVEGEPLSISCKLPRSGAVALMLPFAKPTPYGLGKSGWVSAQFPADQPPPPLDMLKAWIDESYRAQAPKKLIAVLDGSPPARARPSGASRSAARRPKPRPAAKARAARPSASRRRG
jgi:hypothetical protein